MAMQCKYCGTELPKEDARFCNNCGMLVPSHPFSPESLSAVKHGTKNPVELEKGASDQSSEQPVEAEKLPETPRPEVSRRTVPPSRVAYKQISPLVSPRSIPGVRRKMPGVVQMSPVPDTSLEPGTQVSLNQSVVHENETQEEQRKASSAPALSTGKAAPAREFRVAVWEDEEMRGLSNDEEQAIEDLPTRAVAVPSVEELTKQAADVPVEDVSTQVVEAPVEDVPTQVVEAPIEDVPTQAVEVSVDDLPTQSLGAVQMPMLARMPASPAYSEQMVGQEKVVEDWRTRLNDASGSANPAFQAMQPNAVSFASAPSYQPVNGPMAIVPQEKESVVANPLPVRRSRKRWPIVVVLLLLVVLAAGGGTVFLLSQPSGSESLLQPQISFSNPQLGIALLYPNGWIQQVEAAKSTAHFYASNHIGEVDIIVTTGGGDVKQALQQQATKMGLSGVKTAAALTFGGTSWQQLRGTLQVSGANYTDTLLATSQGGKLYIMVQQAPQNNYTDWDKEFFAPLRASFKFL